MICVEWGKECYFIRNTILGGIVLTLKDRNGPYGFVRNILAKLKSVLLPHMSRVVSHFPTSLKSDHDS